MIDNLFQQLAGRPGCVTFPPSSQSELDKCNQTLRRYNFAEITQDYSHLLRLSNGIIYNGVELLGTKPWQRLHKNYIYPDILQVNHPYSRYEFFRSKLILGRSSESLIIYDGIQRLFSFNDRLNLRSRIEVSNVETLLNNCILKLCEF